jgi:hypothetical protein
MHCFARASQNVLVFLFLSFCFLRFTWVLVGPSKNVQCRHERKFLFIILAAPTKTKNSEKNGKHRAKSRTARKQETPRKMENTEETGKQRAKWKNTNHNGLTPSKKAKLWAKLANIL